MTHKLIEQKEIKLIQVGNSKAALIPVTWLEKFKAEDETIFVLRLCEGKKGMFFDGYKKGR
ncbi:hypothetical protein LCGC14_1026870 [marine sediment metagenome]|uniref:Uncharacterized protein n=1 Tax=marine sediment metagenome TaxID=412755 RepID=A0A0F9MVT6_9ZZZZ